jgi:hypothetical protein
MLTSFFGAYFAPANAYAAAEAWLLDALSTDDPKLPGTNLDLIWNRAQNYTQALGNDLTGLDIPSEALTPHITPAYAAFAHAEAYARSSAKVDLWQHAAALNLKDLRAEAIIAAGGYISALSKADAAVATAKVDILDAETRLKSAGAAWYAAQIDVAIRNADRNIIMQSSELDADVLIASLGAKYSDLAVKAAVAGAGAVGMAAQAATASLNSVTSSSTAAFA